MLALLVRSRSIEVVEDRLGVVSASARGTTGIPETLSATRGLHALFARRVGTLPAQVSTLLTVAACMGNIFDFEVLLKVSSRPQEEIISILQWALRNQLVEEEWGSSRQTFRFRHDVIREALCGTLDVRSRRRMHLLIGGATEDAMGSRLRDVYELLSDQFEASDQFEKAVEYASLGADRFYSLGERELAARLYAKACSVARRLDGLAGARVVLWCMRVSELLDDLGEPAAARRCAEHALSLASAAGDVNAQASVRRLIEQIDGGGRSRPGT